MKDKGNKIESRAQDPPLSLQHRASHSHKIEAKDGEHSADNTTLKYNNPQNMNHSQVNKRKAKEIKNLASKGLSPQTLDSSFNKSPTKRLSRFERIECESNSAEIETFESKSKTKIGNHAPSPKDEQKEQDNKNVVCSDSEWDDCVEENQEQIQQQAQPKEEIVRYIEETHSFVLSSGRVIHSSAAPPEQVKLFVMRNQAQRMSSQGLNPHSKWDKKKMQLKDTLENIYANRLPYEDIERMLFNEEFFEFIKQVSLEKNPKNDNWKGMDYLLTEIVRKARDHLGNKKRALCQRANKKENNNYFLNKIKGKYKNKIYNREMRPAASSIIVQRTQSSIIQQFREAPSAYILFVNELVIYFTEVRKAAMNLEKIFSKLKDHFFNDTEANKGAPNAVKTHAKMDVDIIIEHMALFFHDLMKDQAIYKIMKSAQQTLEDDKITIKEYIVFKQIITVYKRIYAYSKQCYRKALIRQKFEDPKMKPGDIKNQGKPQGNGRYCNNKNCANCYPKMQAEAARLEAARQEAARQEAARLDTEKNNGAHTEDSKTEQTNQDTAQSESPKAEDVKTDNTKSDVHADSAKLDAAKLENTKTDNMNIEHMKTESVKTEDVKTESVKTENVKTENAKAENEKVENAKAENMKTEVHKAEDNKTIEEDKTKKNPKLVSRSNQTNEENVNGDDDDDDEDLVDEEDEESSEDEIEFEDQTNDMIGEILDEYKIMMMEKMEQERNREKISKEMNDLSVDEVVKMIENGNENFNNKCPKKKKKNKKKKKVNKENFEEEIETKSSTILNFSDHKDNNSIEFGNTFSYDDNSDENIEENLSLLMSKDPNLADNFHDFDMDHEFLDEETIVQEFKDLLESYNQASTTNKIIPNISIDWIMSLRNKRYA